MKDGLTAFTETLRRETPIYASGFLLGAVGFTAIVIIAAICARLWISPPYVGEIFNWLAIMGIPHRTGNSLTNLLNVVAYTLVMGSSVILVGMAVIAVFDAMRLVVMRAMHKHIRIAATTFAEAISRTVPGHLVTWLFKIWDRGEEEEIE